MKEKLERRKRVGDDLFKVNDDEEEFASRKVPKPSAINSGASRALPKPAGTAARGPANKPVGVRAAPA